MLWLVLGSASYQIIECNTHFRDGKYQLWVERSNGKSLKVFENADEGETQLRKEAIDHCIKEGHKTLELN